MKKYLPVVVILVVLFGGYTLFKGMSAPQSESVMMEGEGTMMEGEEGVMESEGVMMEDEESMMEDEEAVKTFTLDAQNISFSQVQIRVKKGDRVKIVLVNKEGFHDWTIDEFDANTQQISEGDQDSVEFVADQVGTFEYYCSVGTHRQLGMVGNLIVE